MARRNKHVIKATIYDKRGRKLSTGFNNYRKTHPRQALYARRVGENDRIFLHAEIVALLKCKFGQPYKIVVERFTRDGKEALAKPCKICFEALRHSGIQVIEYTK